MLSYLLKACQQLIDFFEIKPLKNKVLYSVTQSKWGARDIYLGLSLRNSKHAGL